MTVLVHNLPPLSHCQGSHRRQKCLHLRETVREQSLITTNFSLLKVLATKQHVAMDITCSIIPRPFVASWLFSQCSPVFFCSSVIQIFLLASYLADLTISSTGNFLFLLIQKEQSRKPAIGSFQMDGANHFWRATVQFRGSSSTDLSP